MADTLSLREYGFHEWLWHIVGDIRRLSAVHGFQVTYRVSHEQTGNTRVDHDAAVGLWITSHPPPDLPPRVPTSVAKWINKVAGANATGLYPFELLCAFRCPYEPPTGNGLFYGSEPWLIHTDRAAGGLFAPASWVRFAAHLFNPMALMYQPPDISNTIQALAGEVWSSLLGGSALSGSTKWWQAKRTAESGNHSWMYYRPKFWSREVNLKEIDL